MLQDIVTGRSDLFAPGLHTEIRAQLNRDRVLSLMNGSVVANVRQDVSGVSARVYQAGVCGFSAMAGVAEENLEKVVRAARENAEFMNRHIAKNKPALPAIPKEAIFRQEDVSDPEQKLYMDAARFFDDYVAKKYPSLAARRVTGVGEHMEKVIATSDGADGHIILPRSLMAAGMTALTDAGAPVSLSCVMGGSGTFDRNLADLTPMLEKIDQLYERLMKKREGVFAEAGEKTVILGGHLSGMLAHEAVGHTVEADLVLGGSVAGPALGKRVASDLVSLTDFATAAFGAPTPMQVTIDDEGTPGTDAKLIENGILVGYMHSRESAQHFGMQPCGNARGYLFSDEPLIRMRNTAIHPGSSTLEEMIASVDDGYYLIETNNGQADMTGEFMFGVTEGYEIKNGKLGRAILDTTISGVAFEMLKTVDMVGNEINWSCFGTCGKKQPMPVGMGGPALRCRAMIGGR